MAARWHEFEELPEGLELVASFGRFRVNTGIAVGRCCEVYEGEDSLEGESVAVKVFMRNQKYEGALQRELFFLKSLAAPGAPLVRHYGELQWKGRDILVQELLGPTLREILLSLEEQPCSPWLVTTLTTHLLRGVQYLHSRGVIHGDLKPPNILWDGASASFKIIDFGISFTTSEKLTHTIQSKGYQAPESVVWSSAVADRNFERVQQPGAAADVWSVGCIVGECLVNKQLFPVGYNVDEILEQIHLSVASVKSRFPTKYLEDGYKFLIRCLKRCPNNRDEVALLLENPWLHHHSTPSFHDLLHLPTRVLRIMGVTHLHPHPYVIDDVKVMLVRRCGEYGTVEGHHLEASVGHLYVCFHTPQQAEAALDHLSDLPLLGHTLVVTFYPHDYWIRREFF